MDAGPFQIIYTYNRSSFHCHRSLYVGLGYLHTLLILISISHTAQNNLSQLLLQLLPASSLSLESIDIVRRSKLSAPSANSFTNLYQRSLYFGSFVFSQRLANSSSFFVISGLPSKSNYFLEPWCL